MWTILHGNPHGERPRGDAWNRHLEASRELAFARIRELLEHGVVVFQVRDPANNLVMDEDLIAKQFGSPRQLT